MSNEYNSEKLKHDSLTCLWYPFTQMQEHSKENPVIICSGEGNYLIDINDNRYLDGVSSLWTNVHGHQKKKLDTAIQNQLGKIAHSTLLGLSNVPAITCAKKLIEITPDPLSRVFYSDNGSTAVEISIKMAYQYHQQSATGNSGKTKFITFTNAYHGDTIGSVSIGGIDLFHSTFKGMLFDTIQIPSPYCYRCPYDNNIDNSA